MEEQVVQILNFLMEKFPIAMTIYMIASGLYIIFCAVAALTKTDKDDKLAEKLKVFFSLPVKKK